MRISLAVTWHLHFWQKDTDLFLHTRRHTVNALTIIVDGGNHFLHFLSGRVVTQNSRGPLQLVHGDLTVAVSVNLAERPRHD